MIYIFAGFPKSGINASGLQYAIEVVEELGEIEHDPAVQYRKEGVFSNNTDELLYDIEYRMSDMCIAQGITWDWFPTNFAFGNGVSTPKTVVNLTYKTVIQDTE